MATVALTGATGFIGRALVRRLLDEHTVRCAVRDSGRIDVELLRQCDLHEIGSIGPGTNWSDFLEGADVVVHLAAIAHGKSNDSVVINQVNVEGARALALAAARQGVKRFVLLSSIGVLGDRTASVPFTEDSKLSPYDAYSQSKVDAELAVVEVGKAHELEVVIVRPPLVYGPNAPGNFARLTALVQRGLPLPFGSIGHPKSLVSVGNLADFLTVAAVHPAAANEAFVICDGDDVTLPELLTAMACAMARPNRVFRFPEALLKMLLALAGRSDELRKLTGELTVDASKARNMLQWAPPETFAEGVVKAVESCQTR